MKRVLCFGLLLVLLLTGCGVSPADPSGRLQIVTTSFAPYDFTRAVAGEDADVTMLLRPGSESHSYEPTAQDLIAISECDVFVYVGGESDAWLDDMMDALDMEDAVIVRLMELADVLEEETSDSMTVREGAHTDEEEYDEHVWTSPRNAGLIVDGIAEALCAADEAHAEAYRARAEAYRTELDALDCELSEIVENASRKKLVFGDRFPMLYFVREYGLEYAAAFPGCAAQTEPSAATMASLADTIREENIPVILKVELSSDAIAEALSEATGAKVMTFYACHNVSPEDFEAGETYLTFMHQNAATLREALK